MATAPFAALEARSVNAVFSRLSNTVATLDGVAVSGIFDAAYVLAAAGTIGMADTRPAFTLPTASVPASPVGKPLVIGASNYLVAEHQPDGTGVSTLLLEAA